MFLLTVAGQHTVLGDRIKWASTTSRFNTGPAAVQMNFSENGASKDWLISQITFRYLINFRYCLFYS
jgi:hypothetical protein